MSCFALVCLGRLGLLPRGRRPETSTTTGCLGRLGLTAHPRDVCACVSVRVCARVRVRTRDFALGALGALGTLDFTRFFTPTPKKRGLGALGKEGKQEK
jgi:hypothetical protein